MRFSLAVAIAALSLTTSASLVSRQDGLPECAQNCIAKADFGGCLASDNGCLCRSQTFLNTSITCIGQDCKGQDLQDAVTAATELCAVLGVTLTSTPPGFPTLTGTLLGPAPSATGPTSAAGNSTSTAASAAPTGSGAASVNGISTVAGIAALGLAVLAL